MVLMTYTGQLSTAKAFLPLSHSHLPAKKYDKKVLFLQILNSTHSQFLFNFTKEHFASWHMECQQTKIPEQVYWSEEIFLLSTPGRDKLQPLQNYPQSL